MASGMSVFRLKSDLRFFENRGSWHKIDQIYSKHGQISVVSKDRLDSGNQHDIRSLNTVSTH